MRGTYKTHAPAATDHRTMVDEPVRFSTRVALVLRDDLERWQAANVAAFLAIGIAVDRELLGEPYVDEDGTTYRALLGQPIVVLQGDGATLQGVRTKAAARDLRVAIFDRGMFATGHDAANRAVVAGSPGAELDLVGVAVHGAKNPIDRILKGVALYR